MVGYHQEDGLVVREFSQPSDHPIGGFVSASNPFPAASEGCRVCTAAPVHPPNKKVICVIRGVRFDHQEIPTPGPGKIVRNVGDSLMVKLQELKISFVIDQAEGIPGGVLQEISGVSVYFSCNAFWIGISVGRPDLGDK